MPQQSEQKSKDLSMIHEEPYLKSSAASRSPTGNSPSTKLRNQVTPDKAIIDSPDGTQISSGQQRPKLAMVLQ